MAKKPKTEDDLSTDDLLLLDPDEVERDRPRARSWAERKAEAEGVPFLTEDDL